MMELNKEKRDLLRGALIRADVGTFLSLVRPEDSTVTVLWCKINEYGAWNPWEAKGVKDFPFSSDLLADAFYDFGWSLS